MIDVAHESEVMHQSLVERELQITREAVDAVFDQLIDTGYESVLEEDVWNGIRDQVLSIMTDEAQFASMGSKLFATMVIGTMLKKEIMETIKLPEDLGVSPEVLEKMTVLTDRVGKKEQDKILAHIILNCDNRREINIKTAAAGYSTSCTQILMPRFWKLCEEDESAKGKLLGTLAKNDISEYVDDPEAFFQEFCFDAGTTPYGLFVTKYANIPADMKIKIREDFVSNMLILLREYLLG